MKDKSELLLFENEIKIIGCIKRNVLVGAKEINNKDKIINKLSFSYYFLYK